VSHQPDLSCERRLRAQGYVRIAGLDEAGRGAWAGPVVAATVVLPLSLRGLHRVLEPIRDSKLLTPRRREFCYDLIVEYALDYAAGFGSPEEIDRFGIVPATRMAMSRAVASLVLSPDYLLIDALPLPELSIPQEATPKADRHRLSVAAASIIAKVTRDHWMIALDQRLPGYGLARHKGYGTREHRVALHALGPTSYHRHSYAPIRILEGAWNARYECDH
jgi:ribonuclease HII